jgi:hypothetical protein
MRQCPSGLHAFNFCRVTEMDPKSFSHSLRPYPSRPKTEDMYREFDATELYCPRCKQAVPVRKRLLLVLPEGDKYEYLCGFCSTTVGTKMDRKTKPISLIV